MLAWRRGVDGLIGLLAGALIVVALTGGMTVVIGGRLVDLTAMHTVARPLAALLLLRWWVWKDTAGPVWDRFTRAVAWGAQHRAVPLLVLAAAFGLMFGAHVMRHAVLQTNVFDVVHLQQPVYRPWGQPLLRCDACLNATYLGEHISFGLLLISPITSWLKLDELTFLVGTLLLAVPLVVLIRRGPIGAERNVWLGAILVILAHRAVRAAALFDFREDELLFAALVGCLIALYRGRTWVYVGCLIVALLSKENVAFATVLLPVPILWSSQIPWSRSERRAMAVLTGVASVVWISVCFGYLIPKYLPPSSGSIIAHRLEGFGDSAGAILVTLLTSPRAWWRLLSTKVFTWQVATYLAYLLGPFVYFYRSASLVWLLPAVPGVLMNIVSDYVAQRSLGYHYDLVVLPFLIFGMLVGMTALRPTVARLSVGVLVALCFSGISPAWNARNYIWLLPERFSESRFLRSLPDDGVIAASAVPIAQLTRMNQIRQLFLPADPSADIWDAFVADNTTDRTTIPGHGALEARRIILDRTVAAERRLEDELKRRGWTLVAQSPRLRFALLGAP